MVKQHLRLGCRPAVCEELEGKRSMEKEEPQTAVQLGGSHKPMRSPRMKTAVEESCTEQGGPGPGPLGRLVMEGNMARAWRLRWVLKG